MSDIEKKRFEEDKNLDLTKTNFFYTFNNLASRLYFKQAFDYFKIKLNGWIKDSYVNTQLYYVDGHYYGDILDEDIKKKENIENKENIEKKENIENK